MRMKEIVQIDCTNKLQLKLILTQLKADYERRLSQGIDSGVLKEQIYLISYEIAVMEGK
jgi:hypothetical protein